MNHSMISEIDVLLSRYVERHIIADLGIDMIKKIKNRLQEKGYTLTESIKMFYPFRETLEEFFGNGADGMLKKIFHNVFVVNKKSINKLSIKDPNFANLILETYGNKDKKSILQVLTNSSMSIAEILEKANVPKSSGYKIINSLIDDGFLSLNNEKTKNPGGNKVSTYKSTVSSVDIKIKNSAIEIELQFSENSLKKSRIIALSSGRKSF